MTFVTARPNHKRKTTFYNGFDRLLDDFFRADFPHSTVGKANYTQHPAVNILETDKDFQLEFLTPGWEKSDFQIHVEKDILTVSAETPKKEETAENKSTWRRREFGRKDFKRGFRLPETVSTETIDARYLNGVLTLTLPKREENKTTSARRIEIA